MPDLPKKDKAIFNKILFIFIAFIISYLTTATGNYLNVFFPGYFIYTYNKYIVFILMGLLLIKNMARENNSLCIEMPALGYATLLMIFILMHGIYPSNDNWYFIGARLLEVYIYFILIINLVKTREEYILFGTIFTLNSVLLMILYISKLSEFQFSFESRLMSEEVGFNVNANSVSYLALLSLIIFNSLIAKNKNKVLYLFPKALLFFLVLFVITINQTRGAFMIMFLFIFIEIFQFKNKKELVVNIVLLVGISLLFYYTLTYYIINFTTRFSEVELYGVRLYYIDDAIKKFLDNPLWGKGYDALLMKGEESNHLWYLDLLVSYGIFGFILFLLWFFKIIPFMSIFKSRFSSILLLYIFIYLFLAPPITFFPVIITFLYQDSRDNLYSKNNKLLSMPDMGVVNKI